MYFKKKETVYSTILFTVILFKMIKAEVENA
jgi:hypothetical protein